jgi:hypothetical protein
MYVPSIEVTAFIGLVSALAAHHKQYAGIIIVTALLVTMFCTQTTRGREMFESLVSKRETYLNIGKFREVRDKPTRHMDDRNVAWQKPKYTLNEIIPDLEVQPEPIIDTLHYSPHYDVYAEYTYSYTPEYTLDKKPVEDQFYIPYKMW